MCLTAAALTIIFSIPHPTTTSEAHVTQDKIDSAIDAANNFMPFADQLDYFLRKLNPKQGKVKSVIERKMAIRAGLRWMKTQPLPTLVRDAANFVWETLGYTAKDVESWMWHYLYTGRIPMSIDRRFKLSNWMRLPGEAKVTFSYETTIPYLGYHSYPQYQTSIHNFT